MRIPLDVMNIYNQLIFNNYAFIWLHRVLVEVRESLRCIVWLRDGLVVVPGLIGSIARGILGPQAGIKPASLALEGRFLTTGPPRKSQ